VTSQQVLVARDELGLSVVQANILAQQAGVNI
jgi:hypothetical protein